MSGFTKASQKNLSDLKMENKDIPFTENSKLIKMTINYLQTLKYVDPKYSYEADANTKRILTVPAKAVYNNGYDNKNHDLILAIDDVVKPEDSHGLKDPTSKNEYCIKKFIGKGTFGQVSIFIYKLGL